MPSRYWQASVSPSMRATTVGGHQHVLRRSMHGPGMGSRTAAAAASGTAQYQNMRRHEALRNSSAGKFARAIQGRGSSGPGHVQTNRLRDHGLLMTRSLKLTPTVSPISNRIDTRKINGLDNSRIGTMQQQLQHHRKQLSHNKQKEQQQQQQQQQQQRPQQASLVIRSQHKQFQQHLLSAETTVTHTSINAKYGNDMHTLPIRDPWMMRSPQQKKSIVNTSAIPTMPPSPQVMAAGKLPASGSMWTSRMSHAVTTHANNIMNTTPTKIEPPQLQTKDNSWMTTVGTSPMHKKKKSFKTRKVVRVQGGSTNKQLAAAKRAFRENASKRARAAVNSRKKTLRKTASTKKKKKKDVAKPRKIRSPGSPSAVRGVSDCFNPNNIGVLIEDDQDKGETARSISDSMSSGSTKPSTNKSGSNSVEQEPDKCSKEILAPMFEPEFIDESASLSSVSPSMLPSPTSAHLPSDTSISDSTISDDGSDASEMSQDFTDPGSKGNSDSRISASKNLPTWMVEKRGHVGTAVVDDPQQDVNPKVATEMTQNIKRAAASAKSTPRVSVQTAKATKTITTATDASRSKSIKTKTKTSLSHSKKMHKIPKRNSSVSAVSPKKLKNTENKSNAPSKKKSSKKRQPRTSRNTTDVSQLPPPPPPPPPHTARRSSVDTGLDELRQAGFTVVQPNPGTAGGVAKAEASKTSKNTPRKPPAPIDTGLGALKKKGFVVLRKKSQSSPIRAVSASQKPTMSAEELEKLSAKRAAEAAQRVQLHRAAAAKKQNTGSPQQEMLRTRKEQRTLAEKNKLVKRARIYAMNCVMKAYRLVQIEAFKNGQSLEATGTDIGDASVADMADLELVSVAGATPGKPAGEDDKVDTRCLAV